MSKNRVVIQQRIDEVMRQEFEKLIASYNDDPLLKLILNKEIEYLSIDEIKKRLEGEY